MFNYRIKNNENTTSIINKLKSMSKQYKTLTKDEELKLIEENKNNREKLNQLLFKHNIKIVFNIAKKYMLKTNDFDNLVQDGMLGLAIACKRFDINRNCKFITYATWWVRKYILMYFYSNQNKIDRISVSLNTPTNINLSSSENETTLESYVNEYIDKSVNNIKSIDNEISLNEQKQLCGKLFKEINKDTSLSAIDKEIFYKLMYNKEKPKLLAEKYNITIQNINSIKSKILIKFKKILNKNFNIKSYYDIEMI